MALCALCCSLPLLAGLGLGSASLAAIGFFAERAGIVLVALGALIGVVALVRRRNREQGCGASCSIDCSCRQKGAR